MIHKTTNQKKSFDSLINKNEIIQIRKHLETNPRNLLFFDLITQSGLQIKYLLRLKVNDLIGLKPGEKLHIPELIGKEVDYILLNDKLYNTWKWYLNTIKPNKDDYVIKSRKGSGQLTATSASLLVKKWFEAVGLNGHSAIRRLRNSWNHSNSQTQKDYKKENQTFITNNHNHLGPVKVKSVVESVYQKLFKAIIIGNISPGERLITHKLAKEMNVSQAPVREALRHLQAQGLVFSPQNKGIYAATLSAENFDEIFHLRIMLESEAIKKAFNNIDLYLLERIGSINDKFVMAANIKNTEKMIDLNKQFHHMIYKAANMPILFNLINSLWDRLSPYVHLLFGFIDYYGSGIQNHKLILNAISDQDINTTCAYLKKDLSDAREQLMKHFQKL